MDTKHVISSLVPTDMCLSMKLVNFLLNMLQIIGDGHCSDERNAQQTLAYGSPLIIGLHIVPTVVIHINNSVRRQ